MITQLYINAPIARKDLKVNMYKTKFSMPKYKPQFNLFNQEEKRWCKIHITGFWGKKDNGEWFETCTKGNKLNEGCEVGE